MHLDKSVDNIDGGESEGGGSEVFGVVEQSHPRLEQSLVSFAEQLVLLRGEEGRMGNGYRRKVRPISALGPWGSHLSREQVERMRSRFYS